MKNKTCDDVPCGESMPQCGRMYGALIQPMTTMILLRVLVALFVKQQFALAACPDFFTAGTRSGTCYHKSSRRDTFKRCEQDVCVPLHSTLPMIKNYDEVSDTALAMILSFARGLNLYNDAAKNLAKKRSKKWQEFKYLRLRRLKNLNIGIIGAGRIGSALVRKSLPIFKKKLFRYI